MAPQLGDDLGRLAAHLRPFVEVQDGLAHLETLKQFGPFRMVAGFQIVFRLPPLMVFGDQRGPIFGLVRAVLAQQPFQLCDLLFRGFADRRQFGIGRTDFRLTGLNFDAFEHDFSYML